MKYPRISIGYSSDNYISFYYLENEKDFSNKENSKEDHTFLFKVKEEELLKLEKERLGLDPKKVVFIGMANVSKSNWCIYKSYLNSLEEEEMFFGAYLSDRLFYSADLGLIKNKPSSIKELLNIGDNIELDQIESLLKEKKIPNKVNDDRDPSKMNPFEKGKYYENKFAEKYKSIRWNFKKGSFILLGFPDGLNDDLAYEFKYTGNHRYIKTTLESATFQANFYALNFKKTKIRIQIYLEDLNEIKTYNLIPNKEESNLLIKQWNNMIKGELPSFPYDKPYVCKSCKFNNSCILLNKK